MNLPAFETRWVTCPTCGGPSRYAPDQAFRPFCSERCKQADLGAWASEHFRMPATSQSGDEPDDPPETAALAPHWPLPH